MPKTPWADRYRAAPTNKSNVMRTIILEGPISRAALAKRVGLSLPSVMTITENLINRGLVRAVGKGKSSGGKPPELLSVVPESEYYMGVDIGRGTIRLVLMNLAQKVVYGTMVETGEVQPVEAFVDRLCERIQSSLLESGVALDRLAGVGVAMPGLIERDTGHILFSPDFGWSDIPLQSWLQSRLSYPVLVENANRALALAESGWRGDGGESGTHTVLCVNIGHGIGAALMHVVVYARAVGNLCGDDAVRKHNAGHTGPGAAPVYGSCEHVERSAQLCHIYWKYDFRLWCRCCAGAL